MRIKLLIPAIVFLVLSLMVIISNTIYMLKGAWGIWTINHWGAVIFHAVTMIVALYLFTGAFTKEKEK